jgi:hypothetical protein
VIEGDFEFKRYDQHKRWDMIPLQLWKQLSLLSKGQKEDSHNDKLNQSDTNTNYEKNKEKEEKGGEEEEEPVYINIAPYCNSIEDEEEQDEAEVIVELKSVSLLFSWLCKQIQPFIEGAKECEVMAKGHGNTQGGEATSSVGLNQLMFACRYRDGQRKVLQDCIEFLTHIIFTNNPYFKAANGGTKDKAPSSSSSSCYSPASSSSNQAVNDIFDYFAFDEKKVSELANQFMMAISKTLPLNEEKDGEAAVNTASAHLLPGRYAILMMKDALLELDLAV